jgi:hypothetical protein
MDVSPKKAAMRSAFDGGRKSAAAPGGKACKTSMASPAAAEADWTRRPESTYAEGLTQEPTCAVVPAGCRLPRLPLEANGGIPHAQGLPCRPGKARRRQVMMQSTPHTWPTAHCKAKRTHAPRHNGKPNARFSTPRHARSKAPCKANTRLSRHTHTHTAIVAAVVVRVSVVGRHSNYSYGYSYMFILIPNATRGHKGTPDV